jgi:hypothetical protein
VELDGVLRNAELSRDGLVAEPVADRREDFDLAWGQQIELPFRHSVEGRTRRLRGTHDQTCPNRADRRVNLFRRGVVRQHPGLSAVVAADEQHGGRTAVRRGAVRQHDVGIVRRLADHVAGIPHDRRQGRPASRIGCCDRDA